jgi:hypothetical protein
MADLAAKTKDQRLSESRQVILIIKNASYDTISFIHVCIMDVTIKLQHTTYLILHILFTRVVC